MVAGICARPRPMASGTLPPNAKTLIKLTKLIRLLPMLKPVAIHILIVVKLIMTRKYILRGIQAIAADLAWLIVQQISALIRLPPRPALTDKTRIPVQLEPTHIMSVVATRPATAPLIRMRLI